MPSKTDYMQIVASPCCIARVRIRLGNKEMCLSWKEAEGAAKALKDLARKARRVPGKSVVRDGGRK